MLSAFNESIQSGELTISQRRRIITLLHKKGKDERFIKNWRPVSLLNIDYNIFTKTIASHVDTIISKIIHEDQSGFIKGRFIVQKIFA